MYVILYLNNISSFLTIILESLVLKLPLGVTFNNQYGNPP